MHCGSTCVAAAGRSADLAALIRTGPEPRGPERAALQGCSLVGILRNPGAEAPAASSTMQHRPNPLTSGSAPAVESNGLPSQGPQPARPEPVLPTLIPADLVTVPPGEGVMNTADTLRSAHRRPGPGGARHHGAERGRDAHEMLSRSSGLL
jgi:hypothetical protein